MSHSYTAGQLAEIVGGTLCGDPQTTITGVADLREARPTDAGWLSSPKFRSHVMTSRAGVILLPLSIDVSPTCAIVCENIQRSVARLLAAFAPPLGPTRAGVHPTAVVDPTASLGDNVVVGAHVTIDFGVTIGDRTQLEAGVYVGQGTVIGRDCCVQQNVVIRYGCRLGDRVTVLPNAVIGADGFGFYFDQNAHQRIPHIGGVIIEDDVEIGACTCVDRAKFDNTVIGAGTKIDNLVQVAHNVRVGSHCVFAGQAAIGGSASVGDGCVLAGRAGVTDNIEIGDGARIAVGAIACGDVAPGASVAGNPAQDHIEAHRSWLWLRRLPSLAAQLRELRIRLEKLETPADHQP